MNSNSVSVSIDLSFEQLVSAVRRLPAAEKVAMWRLLDQDIDRAAIAKRFSDALKAIRSAYPNVDEQEVMADALFAIREVRSLRHNDQDRS